MMPGRRNVARSCESVRGRALRGPVEAAVLAIVLVAVFSATGAGILGVSIPWAENGGASADAWTAEEPCTLFTERSANPLNPVLGSELTISTKLRTSCGPDSRPMHLVLLVDASDAMAGEPLRALQDELERTLLKIDLPPSDRPEIAVVAFGDVAVVKRALTTSVEQIVAGLRDIEAGGASCLDCGLEESLKVLRAGRLGAPPARFREVILLLSPGVEDECERIRSRANEVKAHRVVLVIACKGHACDRGCLFETASTRRYVFAMKTWTELDFRLRELLTADGAFHPIDRVILVDQLADELAYLEGGETSAVDGNRLLWIFEPWTTDVLTRTYRAGVAACGRFPLGDADEIGVTIEYNMAFWEGDSFEHPLPNPIVNAECPTATATPTRGSPTPTGARPTEATPTASTPPPEPTPRAWHAHLPIALAGACAPMISAIDLVIAIDVSHSMYLTPMEGMVEEGGAWRAAALVAAATVEGLRPAIDRVGVIAYGDDSGDEAFIERPIHACCDPGLIPSPDDLWRLDGSRIDRAIARGVRMHEDAPRSAGAERALIVLTDGDLNQTSRARLDDALRAANGAEVFTEVIILGAGDAAEMTEAVEGAGGRVRRWERIDAGVPRWIAARDLCP